jgi:hypothetical protein
MPSTDATVRCRWGAAPWRIPMGQQLWPATGRQLAGYQKRQEKRGRAYAQQCADPGCRGVSASDRRGETARIRASGARAWQFVGT